VFPARIAITSFWGVVEGKNGKLIRDHWGASAGSSRLKKKNIRRYTN